MQSWEAPDKPMNRTHLSLNSPRILVKSEGGRETGKNKAKERWGDKGEGNFHMAKHTRLSGTTAESRVNGRCSVPWKTGRSRKAGGARQGEAPS